jgi:hypothetical protein
MKDARRKLLKGSLAAPLLLTLRPAGAQALRSAAVCVRRDELRGADLRRPQELTLLEEDEWLRARVNLVELQRFNSNQGLDTLEGKFFIGSDNTRFWRLQEAGPKGLFAVPTNYTVHDVVPRSTGEVRFALVSIGPDGQPNGYLLERRGGFAITGSCWHSFRAARGSLFRLG